MLATIFMWFVVWVALVCAVMLTGLAIIIFLGIYEMFVRLKQEGKEDTGSHARQD